MELRESIEQINKKLIDEYGYEFGDKPKFRIVFSEDQYEKRWTNYTDEGFELIQPEVRLLPKYKQYIKAKYLLERLIPVTGETDLLNKISYECLWVFEDKNHNYLPPFFDGCKHVIESMFQSIGKKDTFVKYKDKNTTVEERRAELKRVEDQLFGNESSVTDALAYGTGVTVQKESESKLVH